MAFTVSYVYHLVDKYSHSIRRITSQTAIFQTRVASASKGLTSFGNDAARSMQKMRMGWGWFIAAGGLYKAVESSVRFSTQMADLFRVLDTLSEDTVEGFISRVDEIAAITGVLPQELQKVAFQIGKMGISDLGEVLNLTQYFSQLSVAIDMSVDSAAELFAKTREFYGYTIPQTKNMMDMVNWMGQKTITTEAAIADVIRRVAGQYAVLETGMESQVYWSTMASVYSSQRERGGTSLNIVLDRITRTDPELTSMLMQDFDATMLGLLSAMGSLTTDEQMKMLRQMGVNQVHAKNFLLSMVNNREKIAENIGMLYSGEHVGSALAEWLKYIETPEGKFRIMLARLSIQFRELGKAAVPILLKVGDQIIEIANYIKGMTDKNPKLLQWAVLFTIIGIALTPLLILLGNVFLLLGSIHKFILILLLVLKVVAKFFIGLYKSFASILKLTKDMIRSMVIVARGFVALFGVIKGIGKFLWLLLAPLKKIFILMLGIGAAIGWPLIILLLIIIAVVLLITYFKKWGVITEWIKEKWNELVSSYYILKDGFIAAFNDIMDSPFMKFLSDIAGYTWQGIKNMKQNLINAFKEAADLPIIRWFIGNDKSDSELTLPAGLMNSNSIQLDGMIRIETSGGAKVLETVFGSSEPGNLGFVMP